LRRIVQSVINNRIALFIIALMMAMMRRRRRRRRDISSAIPARRRAPLAVESASVDSSLVPEDIN
jgi:hypothetical protein